MRGKPSVRMVCRPGGHSTSRGSVLARMAGVVQRADSGAAVGMVPTESARSAQTGAVACWRLSEENGGIFTDDGVAREGLALLGEIGAVVRAAAFLAGERETSD